MPFFCATVRAFLTILDNKMNYNVMCTMKIFNDLKKRNSDAL
ncbi:hypothetical protein T4D_15364 [Trichinella pseudospiralis]|uniref:Uncharacterized protein n=1 Tax=Trichinella pseudospiralis TaxID=6337 RepID=A0A0V1DP88_TRIPS|nr:hypothetical protein T4D_15364 [Trichinella pseudospiralis]